MTLSFEGHCPRCKRHKPGGGGRLSLKVAPALIQPSVLPGSPSQPPLQRLSLLPVRARLCSQRWVQHLDCANPFSLPSAALAIACTSGCFSEPLRNHCFISVQLWAGNVAVLPPLGPCLPPPLLARFTLQWLVPSFLVQNPPRRVFFQRGNLGTLLEGMISDKPIAGEKFHRPLWKLCQIWSSSRWIFFFFFNLSKNASFFTMWESSEKVHCCHYSRRKKRRSGSLWRALVLEQMGFSCLN